MLYYLSPKLSTSRSYLDWIRGIVMLALLSILAPTSMAIGSTQAAASPEQPSSAYNCIFPHCYGYTHWYGGTFGAATYILIRNLTCIGCTPSNGYKLNEELWLEDLASGGYIEVGYGARDQQYGATWYFYSNTPPGQGQARHDLAPVPSGNFNNFTGFKLTRNRQGADRILVGIWSPYYNYSITDWNDMGNSTYAGNRVLIGAELKGYNSGGPITQSSNGTIAWINNQWQTNNGIYHYQNVDTTAYSQHPNFASWYILPSNSTTGGEFWASCGC